MRMITRLAAATVALLLIYTAVTVVQVAAAARHDQRSAADVIVVLGAAQYDGQPSPALRNRLDHAVALFDDGLATVIWVTGGRQPGDRFTEASASARYLIRAGVPSEAVEREVHGENTYQSLAAAARFLRDRNQRRVLLVSDPWHSYRLAAVARELGLRPAVSPAAPAQISWESLRRMGRETLAVGLGRALGYRRLTGLEERGRTVGRD